MGLAVLVFLAVAAVAPARAQDAVSDYSFDLNLAEISQGVLRGRYRVDVSYRYREPEKAAVSKSIESSDVTGPHDVTDFGLSGASLHSVEVSIRPLDADGHPGEVAARRSWSGDTLWPGVPVASPSGGWTTQLGGGWTALPALDFNDGPTGRAALLNIDASQSVVARFQPGPNGTWRFVGYAKNEPDLLGVRAVVANVSRYDGKLYKYDSIVEAGRPDQADVQCRASGEIRLLRPQRSVDGSSTGRAEVCYPSGRNGGFERIVVGVRNPDHHFDYGQEVWGLTERTRAGGRVADDHLYPISPGRLPELNCFGYALLATRPELARELPDAGYWISGNLDELSEGTKPFQVILKSRYDLVKRVPIEKAAELSKDPDVRPGDLAALFNGADYDHAGVLVDHGGELWLQSKVGESFVYDSPLENLDKAYNSRYVEVYRVKGAPAASRTAPAAFERSRAILKNAESLGLSLQPR